MHEHKIPFAILYHNLVSNQFCTKTHLMQFSLETISLGLRRTDEIFGTHGLEKIYGNYTKNIVHTNIN